MYATRTDLLLAFGNPEFVRDIVSSFLDRAPVLLESIGRGLESGDFAAAGRAAHSLKGCLSYFASGPLHDAAAALEHLHSGDDLAAAASRVTQLDRELPALLRHLERLLDAA